MSPQMRVRRDGTVRPSRRGSVQLPMVLWLTLVWCAIWGTLAPITVIGGVLVAVLACVVFPLPPLKLSMRIRPLAALALIGIFLWDVVRASLQVAWVVLRPNSETTNAVVKVDLNSESDFVLAGVAVMLSLVPGSIVVEARRSTHTLFLHVIDVADDDDAEEFRASALAVEQRVLRAFGITEPKAGA